jgi:creatinine amidohydrolase
MSKSDAGEWRYEKLTWEEINERIADQPICVVPVGAVEQHGPHLPLDVDMVLVSRVAQAAGERLGGKALVLPCIPYGYTGHVMDFPGTINVHYSHFIEQVLDVAKSLAYHGFKKILLLNGHGSNMPNLDIVARRCNVETDAQCAFGAWWSLLTIDPEFLSRWRESSFPGGCAHACELETSVYMHLCPNDVRVDRIVDGAIAINEEGSRYQWVDLFAAGAMQVKSWTSWDGASGVFGKATMASAVKGKAAFDEAVFRLVEFLEEWRRMPKPKRRRRHATPPTFPMPWGQSDSLPFEESTGSAMVEGDGKASTPASAGKSNKTPTRRPDVRRGSPTRPSKPGRTR